MGLLRIIRVTQRGDISDEWNGSLGLFGKYISGICRLFKLLSGIRGIY
jgi:hypothetical protein